MFECNLNYTKEYEQFTNLVLTKYGMFSQAAEREAMYLANKGNRAARYAYADLIFFGKITVPSPYEKAFFQYLQAADIAIDESGNLKCGKEGVPQAFAMLGYYFYNYKRDGYVKSCETIEGMERAGKGSLEERIRIALELSSSSLQYVKMPIAINLIGRILDEVSKSEELYLALKNDITAMVDETSFFELSAPAVKITNCATCSDASDFYYNEAAKCGYVYACNNLASREADTIIKLCAREIEGGKSESEVTREPSCEIKNHIEKYVQYLKMSAEKYEPYAANRLGLFYIIGEIRSGRLKKKYNFRSFCDSALAKESFVTATMYPNKNSAWAYYNLLKHFPKDYNMNIDLMNEHMDCIKRLDPEVYDLAIED